MAVSIHDLLDSRRTIVFDQAYAQNQIKDEYGSKTAAVMAQRYGNQLSNAFTAETQCSGLRFSKLGHFGVAGKAGRWKLKVDLFGSEDPGAVPSLQRWSLVQPNRDGAEAQDTLIVKTKGTPAEIVQAACEVVKNDIE